MNIDWRLVGTQVVSEIAQFLRKNIDKPENKFVYNLKEESSPFYNIDREVEDFTLSFLKKEKIPILMKSEDSPVFQSTSNPQKVFILDPLDGSTNATRGIPYYSVSLAIGDLDVLTDFSLDKLDIGIVHNIFSNDTFIAIRNQGAYLNNKKISPSKTTVLSEAIISTYIRFAPQGVFELVNNSLTVRITGSAALELCDVARGVYDSFVDVRNRLKIYDVAAGALIVKEAGGIVEIKRSNDKSKEERVNIISSCTNELYNTITSFLK